MRIENEERNGYYQIISHNIYCDCWNIRCRKCDGKIVSSVERKERWNEIVEYNLNANPLTNLLILNTIPDISSFSYARVLKQRQPDN